MYFRCYLPDDDTYKYAKNYHRYRNKFTGLLHKEVITIVTKRLFDGKLLTIF